MPLSVLISFLQEFAVKIHIFIISLHMKILDNLVNDGTVLDKLVMTGRFDNHTHTNDSSLVNFNSENKTLAKLSRFTVE